jgi:hypothetical protein
MEAHESKRSSWAKPASYIITVLEEQDIRHHGKNLCKVDSDTQANEKFRGMAQEAVDILNRRSQL